jgi:hypothetical protein
MSGTLPIRDYEKLTADELNAARRSTTVEERRTHLDQAGIYAALGEHARGFANDDRPRVAAVVDFIAAASPK